LTDFASTAYWAPEVAERDGKFYMYYSAATGEGDEGHRLRVAIADIRRGRLSMRAAKSFPMKVSPSTRTRSATRKTGSGISTTPRISSTSAWEPAPPSCRCKTT
jgi:beta-xylosidase